AHCRRDARYGAEEVRQHRHVVTRRVLEDERRPAGALHAIADFGDFEPRRDRRAHPLEFAARFQLGEELAQVAIAQRALAISRSAAISATSSSSVSRPRTE